MTDESPLFFSAESHFTVICTHTLKANQFFLTVRDEKAARRGYHIDSTGWSTGAFPLALVGRWPSSRKQSSVRGGRNKLSFWKFSSNPTGIKQGAEGP